MPNDVLGPAPSLRALRGEMVLADLGCSSQFLKRGMTTAQIKTVLSEQAPNRLSVPLTGSESYTVDAISQRYRSRIDKR